MSWGDGGVGGLRARLFLAEASRNEQVFDVKDCGHGEAEGGCARAAPAARLRDKALAFVRGSRHIYHCALWANEVRKRLRPVRGQRNRLENAAVLLGARFDIEGNDNRLIIGRGAVLHGTRIFLRGQRHVLEVGEGCHLKGGTLWFEDEGCLIRIGGGSAFGEVHIAATEPGRQVVIGSGCLFSSDIDIRTGDSHSVIDIASGMRVNPASDVTVGSRV
jgi:hypothetical protein